MDRRHAIVEKEIGVTDFLALRQLAEISHCGVKTNQADIIRRGQFDHVHQLRSIAINDLDHVLRRRDVVFLRNTSH